MAQYCPLPGQYLAVVRQDSLCREGVLLVSATASFSCVSSATFAFTLHSSHFGINPLIINTLNRWRVKLHSSPLFTSLHLIAVSPAIIEAWSWHHWSLELVIIEDRSWSSLKTKRCSWNDFALKKSQGEEWWRVVKSKSLLFTHNTHWISVVYTQNVKSEEWKRK